MSNNLRARQGWEERVGISSMRPLPPHNDVQRRVGLGAREGTLRTRDHAVVVYWERSELMAAVIPYLIEGLNVGDKVVYMADDTPMTAIVSGLRRGGVSVERAIASGKLLLLTAHDTFFADGRFDVESALGRLRHIAESAAVAGFTRVRLSVEMTYLVAEVPGIERGPDFEARANDEVFAQFPFVCLCSFNGNRNAREMLDHVMLTHPIIIANGVPLINRHYTTRLRA